jgi:hypothetical protein
VRATLILAMLGCARCSIYFGERAGDDSADDDVPDPDVTCPASELPEPPPLEPGGYRMELTSWSFGLNPPRVIVEADGSVTGHSSESLWSCDGTATAGELISLTDALQAADALRRCPFQSGCSDSTVYQITIEGTTGDAIGWQNTFTYDPCFDGIPVLDAIIDNAMAIINHVAVPGCTGCPVETAPDECYGNELGSARLCAGQVEHVCTDSAAGEVVECVGWEQTSLECVAEQGWMPAASVSIVDATIERTDDDGYGSPRVNLLTNFRVDNRGDSPVRVDGLWSLLHFYDQDGEPMTLVEGSWAVGLPIIAAPGHTNQVYGIEVNSGTDPGSLVLTVPAMSVRLPERAHFEAPLGPPVDITLIDVPSP